VRIEVNAVFDPVAGTKLSIGFPIRIGFGFLLFLRFDWLTGCAACKLCAALTFDGCELFLL
jgi:hypothetical protein